MYSKRMFLPLKTENYILLRSPRIFELAQALAKKAETWQSEARPARIGQGERRNQNQQIRGDAIQWLERGDSAELDEQLNDWMKGLNETLYLGLQDWECHFAAYPVGARYQRHVDQSRDLQHSRQAAFERVVSFVIYLNADWQPTDGGELVIYSSPDDQKGARISPLLGQAVMFLSEDVEHEVAIAKRRRWSLTGWFLRPTLKDA